MNIPTYDQPHKTVVDRVPVRAVRIAMLVVWIGSIGYLAWTFLTDDRSLLLAATYSLTIAAAITLLVNFESRRFPWKWATMLFSLPTVVLILAGERPEGILAMVGSFLLMAGVVSWMMQGSFVYRPKVSAEIRTKKRVSGLWALSRSGIPEDVIRGMSAKRRRLFHAAQAVLTIVSMSALMVHSVMQSMIPKDLRADVLPSENVLILLALVYAPMVVAIPGMTIMTTVLAAELIEKQTLQGELQAAREAQASLLPASDPQVAGFEISGACRPASEVGGDFYDYVWLDEAKSKLGIAVADVSGKAMQAAMTAVMTSGMLYSEVQRGGEPREVLGAINRPLYLRSDRRTFTAMLFASINVREPRMLTIACAGQIPPLLVRPEGVMPLETPGVHLPLGVQGTTAYSESSHRMEPGSVVVFMTDGITEAPNEAGEEFGVDRVGSICLRERARPAKEIVGSVLEEVMAFSGKDTPKDDMTIVVVKAV